MNRILQFILIMLAIPISSVILIFIYIFVSSFISACRDTRQITKIHTVIMNMDKNDTAAERLEKFNKLKELFNTIPIPKTMNKEPHFNSKMAALCILEKIECSPLRLHALMYLVYNNFMIDGKKELFSGDFVRTENGIFVKDLINIIGTDNDIILPKTRFKIDNDKQK